MNDILLLGTVGLLAAASYFLIAACARLMGGQL